MIIIPRIHRVVFSLRSYIKENYTPYDIGSRFGKIHEEDLQDEELFLYRKKGVGTLSTKTRFHIGYWPDYKFIGNRPWKIPRAKIAIIPKRKSDLRELEWKH